ncbi:hypothetical protein H7K32_26085 [Brevibacillus agri]|uniref:hypothetical protein n=1 Tax=Brevibacillus agri TaxID=51101 RepID=UPI001C8E6CEC|nr:hypothetical protein [Brevibacillus agri]MBY0055032.1 hypothetical protein [Brevibacillus agri]
MDRKKQIKFAREGKEQALRDSDLDEKMMKKITEVKKEKGPNPLSFPAFPCVYGTCVPPALKKESRGKSGGNSPVSLGS